MCLLAINEKIQSEREMWKMMYNHEFEMDELLPVVAWLSEKYTSKESTSISVERAQQLMKAVLYCLHELVGEENSVAAVNTKENVFELYQAGYEAVLQKTRDSQIMLERLLEIFQDYGNENLHATIVEGLTGFFKFYDVRFCPQDTILGLDYPVFCDIRETGIDAIEKYIKMIYVEQLFLHEFTYSFIVDILQKVDKDYQNQFFNICSCISRHVFFSKWIDQEFPLDEEEESCQKLWILLQRYSLQEISEKIQNLLHDYLKQHFEQYIEIEEYLMLDIKECCYRLTQLEYPEAICNVVYLA